MHRLLVLYHQPDDREAFRRHYEETHVGLAQRLPDVLRYEYAFEPDGGETPSPYFCIANVDFADAETMATSLASPEGQAASADVPNFAPKGAVILQFPVVEG